MAFCVTSLREICQQLPCGRHGISSWEFKVGLCGQSPRGHAWEQLLDLLVLGDDIFGHTDKLCAGTTEEKRRVCSGATTLFGLLSYFLFARGRKGDQNSSGFHQAQMALLKTSGSLFLNSDKPRAFLLVLP